MTGWLDDLARAAGSWRAPEDRPAQAAACLAVVFALAAVFGRGQMLLEPEAATNADERIPTRMFLAVVALVAAFLSLGYIDHYLAGGPRIVDATTYFLQGRALSHGSLSWHVEDPSASFRGRFLVFRDGEMGGVFPPGYPLLLAFGFLLRAPMVVGPLLAGALVCATYWLARTIAEECFAPLGPDADSRIEPIARIATLLSLFSAALRYHTADTMSHGASALGVTLALTLALRARRTSHGSLVAGAGLAVGAVVATRPVSAIPIAIVVALVLIRRSDARSAPLPRARTLMVAALGAAPGLLLLAASQRAVTGSWIASTQRLYYALSDGPPGCFRWGFGAATGCVFEHGEFVAARLPRGYGALEAFLVTLRRLRMHALDVANLEPIALLVLAPLLRRGVRRNLATTAALAVIALHVLAYAPFYFDGNYPGGGARLLADVLPLEHALIAITLGHATTAIAFRRAAWGVLALSAGGFAVHASHDHRDLLKRDGGRPMFEPDVLARASVTSGLVFVDTDHGFALGHDPYARPEKGIVVARLRGDDRDRLLYEHFKRPQTFLYKFPEATAVPWAPPELQESMRFEAEAEWPALTQAGGYAVPVWTEACASAARALALTPSPDQSVASATIRVPVPISGRYLVTPRIVGGVRVPFAGPSRTAGPRPTATVRTGDAYWSWTDPGSGCLDLPAQVATLTAPEAVVEIVALGGPVALDRLTLKRMP